MKRLISLTALLSVLILGALTYYLPAEEPAPVPEEPIYQLVSIIKEGDKFAVAQTQKWDGTLTINTPEKDYTYTATAKSIQNEYTETVVGVGDSLKSQRTYRTSHLISNIPTVEAEKGIKDEDTSLKDKTINLETKNNRIISHQVTNKEKATILSDDLAYLTPLTEYDTLLPTMAVKAGDAWKLKPAELGRLVFRDDYNEQLCLLEGSKAVFVGLVNYEGVSCARISVVIQASRKGTETSPRMEIELKGAALYSLDKHLLTYVELTGPFTVSQESKMSDEANATTTYKGNFTITSRVTLAEK